MESDAILFNKNRANPLFLGARVYEMMLSGTRMFTNVPKGSLVFVCYEYNNVYGLGFCGRSGYVKILGTMFDEPISGNTISIEYDRDNLKLTLATTGGSYGLEVIILGVKNT